ncbi:bifunctional 2-polyprenyl-6-hydroxyphenol methylase/3-demethylubiquinol 3-O-methyltransferase UbiG [Alcanivorax sp. DP30]|uniref:class I SAM-dependent methyltransferase n=1 Tax=Alcanivorax sp. DP30 TaxID=2606217 RepID=UPI00136A27A2|nr:class I SAM-dependent methyltransferase [Alcanivorax sp. DP30]MZR63675.1 methyltransferase domain-containing protein [Alcanivorax sp. DP30]
MADSPADSPDYEHKVLDCWRESADHWQHLISHNRLPSRVVTNPAIEYAILSHQPSTVLDVGCGEGWLARQLAAQGISVTGIDAVASLVDTARQQDPLSHYHCLDYDALPGPLAEQHFDLAVCNFSLFGDASVRKLITALLAMVAPDGHLLIQTLHPMSACQGDYREGWRDSQWQGLDAAGTTMGEAPPWYFRTLAGWLNLVRQAGQLVRVEEPLDPQTRLPLSLLIHLSPLKQECNKQ